MKVSNNGASPMDMSNQMPTDDAPITPDMQGGETSNMMDPGMDMPMDDPNMMDSGMEGDMSGNDNMGESNETMDIINRLTPKDQEAVKAYAESLMSQNETPSNDESSNMDAPIPDGLNMEEPVNETFIFKKSQLNKIMETFGDKRKKDGKENILSKKQKKVTKNTPFNAPDFN